MLAGGKQYHEAYCPVCGQLAQWVPLSKELTSLDNSHYYLTDNVTREDGNRYSTVANVTTCVFLNGKTYNQGTADNKEGAIKVLANSTLNIFDTSDNKGTVIGAGAEHNIGTSTAPNKQVTGGAIDVRGTVNIYGGTYKTSRADRPAVGLWQDSSVVNMYGGRIVKGDAIADTSSANSSNVRIRTKGTFNMFGGEITGGKATQGGNVFMLKGGTFNMSGGTISGGNAHNPSSGNYYGGNVYMNESTFDLSGGTITGGDSRMGGNVRVHGTFNMTGGTVSNGTSANLGGNFRVDGTLKISGGEVLNARTNASGGSIGLVSGTLEITGGTIDGGTVTVQNGTVATVELTKNGRVAFAADVAEGTKITVIAPATQTIATVADAANYLKYFEAGVNGATFAVKDGTTNEIVMTIPAQG